LALRSAFPRENLRRLNGFFVFTTAKSRDLMESLQASVAAPSGVSSKLRTYCGLFFVCTQLRPASKNIASSIRYHIMRRPEGRN
jgi:hypothetical protein